MIILIITGYILLIAGILMEAHHDPTVLARNTLEREFAKHSINFDFIFKHDGSVIVEAFKQVGNTIKHVSITADTLLEAVGKISKHILSEIEDWIDKVYY